MAIDIPAIIVTVQNLVAVAIKLWQLGEKYWPEAKAAFQKAYDLFTRADTISDEEYESIKKHAEDMSKIADDAQAALEAEYKKDNPDNESDVG